MHPGVRSAAVALLATLVIAPVAGAGSIRGELRGALPGAVAFKVCAAAGDFWPTMTLAAEGPRIWIACKEQSRLQTFDGARGKAVGSLSLDAPAIAVVSGFGSVWALDGIGTLYRIDPRARRITRRIDLEASAPYNLWVGAGSVWAVDDDSGQVIRVSAASNRVTARIPVGDGPADLVFDAGAAWVVNHRDKRLVRIETGTGRASPLATLTADAPERMAWLGGRLWVTGRGTDLLEVDPRTGAVGRTVEIGAGGIDVVAGGGALWVPSRSVAVDPTGLPTMETLRVVSADGTALTFARPRSRLDVHGLVATRESLWLADNRSGLLYRIALICGDLALTEALGRRPAATADDWRGITAGLVDATATAHSHAAPAQRTSVASLQRFFREFRVFAESVAFAPGKIAATPDSGRASAGSLSAARAAAGRLRDYAGRNCPRAYDVL